MASSVVAATGSSPRAAPMSDNNASTSEDKIVDHKRTLSDPSCTHDQLTKRLRMTLPFERFSALLPLGKASSEDAVSDTRTVGDETGAQTHGPSDDSATNFAPVTADGGDDQHSETDNAAPTGPLARESCNADPDLVSEVDDFIASVRDEVRVKQEAEAEAESDGRAPAALPSFSAHPTVVADGAMNPARAAMIATTTTPQQTKEVRFVEGCGPQKSGMNGIPLGQRKSAGTSQLDPGMQPLSALQPYNGPSHVGGAQPRPTMPWSHPVPPQYQFYGADQYRPPPQFNAPPPQSTHQIQTRKGKKRKASGSVPIPSSTQTVINQFNGFAGGYVGLHSHQPNKVVKRAQEEIKLAQQKIVWDELRESIRTSIRKVYATGRARKQANDQASTAINVLYSIIVGNSKLIESDGNGYTDGAMPPTGDTSRLMLTHY